MLVKIDNINLLSNPVKLSAVSSVIEGVSAISTKFLSKQTQEKKVLSL